MQNAGISTTQSTKSMVTLTICLQDTTILGYTHRWLSMEWVHKIESFLRRFRLVFKSTHWYHNDTSWASPTSRPTTQAGTIYERESSSTCLKKKFSSVSHLFSQVDLARGILVYNLQRWPIWSAHLEDSREKEFKAFGRVYTQRGAAIFQENIVCPSFSLSINS